MKISFIIPAYNAENTIERAIESILNQTNKNLEYEIIVINDGSTDSTDEIIKKYLKYKNIKYIKTENGGLSKARNIGFDNSSGEYIIFVDSDDYVDKNLISDIKEYIIEGIDLIKWFPKIVDDEGNLLYNSKIVEFSKTTGECGFNRLYGTDPLISCVWDYAIKREYVLKFPEGMYHEDFATTPLLMLDVKMMVSLDKYEYYYVQSSNSIMRNNNSKKERKKLDDILVHFDNIINDVEKKDVEEKTKENMKVFATNSITVKIHELEGENKKWFKNELKTRKIYKYIKIRNAKQLIKKACMYFGLML